MSYKLVYLPTGDDVYSAEDSYEGHFVSLKFKTKKEAAAYISSHNFVNLNQLGWSTYKVVIGAEEVVIDPSLGLKKLKKYLLDVIKE